MVKKVKTTFKKMDGSPNSQARALLQLCDTPITKICHHQQRYYMDGLHKELSCPDATDPSTYQESADIYLKFKATKKNISIELTEPRMKEFWKCKNKLDSSHRNSTVQSWNGWQGQWKKFWNENALISSKAQMARNTGKTELIWSHCVTMDHHFKTLLRPKRKSDQTWWSWLLSRPQAKAEKECEIPKWPIDLRVTPEQEPKLDV